MLGWHPLYYGINFEFEGNSYMVGIGGNQDLFNLLIEDEAYSVFVCELEAQ